jgi:hypothetical protein
MSSEKKSGESLVGLDSNLLEKFYEANTEEEQREILRPVSVAILWDRGEISLDGFSRAEDATWVQLLEKISAKIGNYDFDTMSAHELQMLAAEHGLEEAILTAQSMWKGAEKNRNVVRQYVAEKKKLKEEKDASQ